MDNASSFDLETKLDTLLARVASSKLTDTDKERVYKAFASTLAGVARTVFANHVPEDRMDALQGKDAVTADDMRSVFAAMLVDGTMVAQLEPALDELFTELDAMLSGEGM